MRKRTNAKSPATPRQPKLKESAATTRKAKRLPEIGTPMDVRLGDGINRVASNKTRSTNHATCPAKGAKPLIWTVELERLR